MRGVERKARAPATPAEAHRRAERLWKRGGAAARREMLELLLRAARKGHREARSWLVGFVDFPAGKRNPARARTIAELVAETGNDVVAADAACALIYGDGMGGWDHPSVSGADRALGVRLLRRLAERGNVDAMHSLYLGHVRGAGVPKNAREAERWARRALEHGDAEPMNNLGVSLFQGVEFPRDVRRAVRCYRAAAAKSYAIALYNLGLCCRWGDGIPKDPRRAMQLWRRSARLGHRSARLRVACELLDGVICRKSPDRGSRELRSMIAEGSVLAKTELAERLLAGNGVAKDVRKGLSLSKQVHARDPGTGARLLAGHLHALGEAEPRRYRAALRWYELAVRHGDEVATFVAAMCLLEGHPPYVRRNLRRGRALLLRT
jgi:uncharacterized protein